MDQGLPASRRIEPRAQGEDAGEMGPSAEGQGRPVTRIGIVLGLTLALLAGRPAWADDPVESFYHGKTIQLLIGYSPGGGYDTYARVLARHLGDHIPGHPSIVPQNMPGAGSLRATNYLYNVAPKDGSAIATFARGM